MKKTIRLLAAAMAAGACIAASVHADFAKTAAYTEGMFTDVPTTEWFADSVKNAYEYGIMIGDSASTFNPLGTLTVAEGVTIAARINENLTGAAIPAAADGEWYQRYVDYAVANGLMSAGKFADYDRNIKRSEIAELLAVVAGDLPAINNVSVLPDVLSGMPYTAAVLKLYNAGILTGNDDYGTFAPDSNLLRSEISAMAVRIADSAKRVKKDFLATGVRTYGDAYAIIESVWGTGRNGIANGWNYDNRFELFNTTGLDKNYLTDTTDEMFGSLIRDFRAENSGVFNLDMFSNVMSKDGCVYIAFENAAEERLFGLKEVGGKWAMFGLTEIVSDIVIPEDSPKSYEITFRFDLDLNTFSAIIDNTYIGTVDIPADISIQRLVLGTEKAGIGYINFTMCKLNKNYVVADRFLVTKDAYGKAPYGYEITGDFKLAEILSELIDISSVKSETKGGSVSTAKRSFAPVNGVVDFETFILLPEKVDGASFAVTSAGNEVLKIETKNGKLMIGDTVLRDYTANVWQNLHIEADTATGKALIKIDGKAITTVDFTASYFDGAVYRFAPATDAVMWFDDLDIYCLVEHDDYPSYPLSAQNDDYNIGINFCWLWRDQNSGEGWDSVSPFPEFDPYLGYYDEGLRETADWEIKWLAEHGIDFIHACWYSPYGELSAPIKRERVSYQALHDGLMNAKYTDMMQFCIMWENGNKATSTFEGFKEYLWKYWMEYYFTDPRYARLDNKAVLTVWSRSNMTSTFGGTSAGVREAVQWMEQQLKSIGYDGLILLFASQGATGAGTFSEVSAYDATGFYAYHWGAAGMDEDYQIRCNHTNVQNALSTGSHFIPTVSVGFNDVGRNETRDPIVSAEGHLKVCEDIKQLLADSYQTGTWKDNTIMVSTWNEYSEGTYVMPTRNIGFSFLENVRQTFTDAAYDRTALEVVPTEAQVERVSRLYPPHHAPIRWFQFEKKSDSATAVDMLIARETLDMTTDKGIAAFKAGHGLDSYVEGGGVIKGSSSVSDYSVTSDVFPEIDAKAATVIHLRLKTSETANFELFFITDTDSVFNQQKYKAVKITKANEFVDYYVDMSGVDGWKGNVIGLRIDPCTVAASFEISLVEFMGLPENSDNAVAGVTTNGNMMSFTFAPAWVDGDLEVVGEARKMGFYSILRVYHEWDRFTGDGVLTLKTRDNKTLVFTVGSDKALVDGVPVDLGYTFRLRDGLPVFRMKKLCDLLGYPYTVEDQRIYVKAATDAEYEAVTSRKPNEWEFGIIGETEGWRAQNSSFNVGTDGCLTITPTNTDPAMIQTVSFNYATYTHVVCGVKYTEAIAKARPQMFFTTAASTSYTADKCINGTYDLEGKNIGDTVEAVFDLASNSAFNGTITGIRIDTHSSLDVVKVDYVRCVNDPALSNGGEAAKLLLVEDGDRWEFDNDGDLAGWSGQNSKDLTVKDGYLVGTSTNGDPAVGHEGGFAAGAYQAMTVGIRYIPLLDKTTPQMFFITKADNAWNADKGINGKYRIPQFVNEGDTVEVTFDLTANKKWTGDIQRFRFDMFSAADVTYEIDYIRFYRIEGYEPPPPPEPEKPAAATKPTEVVLNAGDAIPAGITVYGAGNSVIDVIDDPKGDGKCWSVTVKNNAQYNYFNIGMHFKAGAVYTIKYKLLPTKDFNGNDYPKTIIGGNFRFKTTEAGMKDHTFDAGADKGSSSDWIDVSVEYHIPDNYSATNEDCFQLWGKFVNDTGINYLVKDVSITVKE